MHIPVAAGAPLGSVRGVHGLLRGGPRDGGWRVGDDPLLDLALVELAEVKLLPVVGWQLELDPLGLGRPRLRRRLCSQHGTHLL